MTLTLGALLLVLACSFAWGGCDLSRKLLAGKIRPQPLVVLITTAAVPIFLGWTLIDGLPEVQISYWAPALASVALNVGANLAFFGALRSSALSVAIPLLSLTPVFTTLLAIPMLGQQPSGLQMAGILLVVAGAFALSLPEDDPLSPAGAWQAWRTDRSALWMVLVAFCWSLTVPLDKLAMDRASGPLHGLVLNFGVGLVVALVLVAQRRTGDLADVRKAPLVFLFGVVISAVALGLQLIAIQTVWVSLVETLKRGIGNGMAVLLGRLVFQEAITFRKIAAVGLMVVGVALILM
ncbi:MAG TPA: DMT family transporter [Thermoanaerobaculia bacterium]|nr:DMT family transporter [Thermoanaerobaculia bacterium]